MANLSGTKPSIPIGFLKNPSVGHTDPYTTHLTSNPPSSSYNFEPLYVPVLQHTFDTNPIATMLSQSKADEQRPTQDFPYGGLIFTSQRAVEAFASTLEPTLPDDTCKLDESQLQLLQLLAIPLYAVGPATARSLEGIQKEYMPCCWVRGGEEAGTGELLAELIIGDYNALCSEPDSLHRKTKENKMKPLLFLTGAKHRDIVPITLNSAPKDQRIDVETMVVYATSESSSFASEIRNILRATATAPIRWIVIFSPTGGESLLRALGWLEEDSSTVCRVESLSSAHRRTYIASIGPTTRDYMKATFSLDVDVCAEKPSPEGVRRGIEEFMRTRGMLP
ncbi:MAG: hypothetical protein L6R40_002311 [Gallowayella cf. fulva]|nr:MAG: hypothetical protein L6R40_002311 [Xanthomendoza cf. fulva]